MSNQFLVSLFSVMISISLLAPPVLQLLEVDMGTWNYLNITEEENQNGNSYELNEKLVYFSRNEAPKTFEKTTLHKIFTHYRSSTSTFNDTIVLPPPEVM